MNRNPEDWKTGSVMERMECIECITSEEMAALDLNCEYFGLSRLQLMENAGMALANEVLKLSPSKVTVFAGLGNNGGDAFVASRILSCRADVEVILLGRSSEIKTEIARRNFELCRLSGVRIFEIRDSEELKELKERLETDCILDAMLGTGVKGKLREPYSTAVDVINSSDCVKIAVDVPTGLNPDSGEFDKAVRADVTVTFHKPKPGLLREEAKECVGKLVVRDIGIPESFEKLAGPGDVKITLRRDRHGHKGTHGRVLIVGGGPYTGAPALAAMAVLKAGADLAFLAVPSGIRETVSSYSPELIVSSLDEVGRLAERCHSAVIGMGMDEEVASEVVKIVSGKCDRIVLDAGALGAVDAAECDSIVLTPHRGELKRYFGIDCVEAAEIGEVSNLAKELNATVLLKGAVDIVTDGTRLKFNRTGNAGMTVGGTGDVLAGVCGAFLAISSDPFRSATSASFITGLAGDICFEELGYCFTAMDLIERLPLAVKKCTELR